MAHSVLAVDDSVTMRKVLEITFASPEFRCVTVNGPDAALQKVKSEKPDVVIADVTLDPKNGYELCKAIKQIAPDVPVVILSSKQNPFDPAKGSAAQADDHMDKPFDTTQMIDKVRKLIESKGAGRPAAAAAPPQAAAARSPTATAPSAAFAQPAMGGAVQPTGARAKTLIYNPGPQAESPKPGTATVPSPSPTTPGVSPGLSPTPVTGVPLQGRAAFTQTTPSAQSPLSGGAARAPSPPAAPPPPAAAAAPAVAASHINGQMAARLEQMGLTPTQVDGVLALSREVVERVVWEVVPVLAETLIREEIGRLTK